MKNKVSTLPKENTNEVKDWMHKAEDDAKGLPDTRDFNSLIKRIPVREITWKSINMEPRYLTKHAVFKLA